MMRELSSDLRKEADRIEAANAREVQHALDHGQHHAEKVAAGNCRDCVLCDKIAELKRELKAAREFAKGEAEVDFRSPVPTAEKSSEGGDAAKLREAVKAVVDVGYPHNFQKEAPHIRGYCYDITRAIDKCFAAIAAPPRNCDVGTAEEQAERFDMFCLHDFCNKNCPLYGKIKTKADGGCVLAWAQMPYKEGGNDGKQ